MSFNILHVVEKHLACELQSAMLYLSLKFYFEQEGLSGFAGWADSQYREELGHADRVSGYILSRGLYPSIPSLSAVSCNIKSPVDAVRVALLREKELTKIFYDTMRLAEEEHDYSLQSLISGFLDEQVEEEKEVGMLLRRLEYVSGDRANIILLDRDLSNKSLFTTDN